MTLQRGLAVLLFGATLLGALAPSFVHVAGWWLAMVPTGMPWLAWVAAFVIEGSLFAALFGIYVVKPGMRGRRWVLALLLLGAAASIYANLAWSLRARGLGDGMLLVWADILFGAVLLPIYAVVTAHAAPHVWERCGGTRRKVARKPSASADARRVGPERKAKRKTSKAEALVKIRSGEFDQVETQAELARALGVSESAVSRWPVVRSEDGWRLTE
ncbi:MAG: helix-turn-helix transcriptional regulator [Caldilineae bacterium]|nr:helix-turn-helix transcriptional regulator [Caldilineae bacterium]